MIRLFIILMALLIHTSLQAYNDTIPSNAYDVLPLVAIETSKFQTPFEAAFVAASIHTESCIYATHPRCFKPTSYYKTRWKNGRRREEGGGMLMLTRTWYQQGGIRFDTLTRLTRKYKTHLKGLTWKTLYTKPKLQVRAGIFLYLDIWNGLPKQVQACQKMAFALSAYNQGLGGVKQDRRICGVKKNCNPNVWFGQVENVKRRGFATRILYGKRTAHQINRKHVSITLKRRLPLYRKYYKSVLAGKATR